jgi:dTDP-glucose 4,6-dehydratase
MQTVLVTGGAGFIGANFVLKARLEQWVNVINLDKLTYASNLQSLAELQGDSGYNFVQGDIGDKKLLGNLLEQYQPDAVINFAAESHVDRSTLSPEDFIDTNVVGTFRLLEASKHYWQKLSAQRQQQFRFLHVSKDEVYGSLSPTDPAFREDTPYAPNNPYAASKAASDHFVRAYHHTYDLPTLTTNCSNNYGQRQFPEKLIPLMIWFFSILSDKISLKVCCHTLLIKCFR